MSMKMKKVLISWVFSLVLIFSVVAGAQAYSDVLAFGDSLSDNGAADGFGNGVYSNGKVWVQYLSEGMGVSLMDMAYGGAVSGKNVPYAWRSVYNNAFAATGSAATATSYANASGYDTKYGLNWQVDTYINNVMGSRNISNTLITMTAGGNDFFNYYANAVLGTPYSPQSAIDYANGLYAPNVVAGNIATAIGKLIGAGGRNFLLQDLAMANNTWADVFNYYLRAYLANYMSADVNITILDMSELQLTGIDNTTDTWMARCAANPAACNGTTYAWFDQVGVHPTTEVHKQIATYASNNLPTAAVPEPASLVLLILGFAGLVGARRRMK